MVEAEASGTGESKNRRIKERRTENEGRRQGKKQAERTSGGGSTFRIDRGPDGLVNLETRGGILRY